MASEPPKDYIDTEDLFGKLDQLISRHQGRGPPRPAAQGVPTLTEAVEPTADGSEPEIPVLHDVVVPGPVPEPARSSTAPLDRQRQIQIALYLHLRQRLDQELRGEAFAFVPPAQISQLSQALRNALPHVVREAVEQVFGDDMHRTNL